MTEKEFNSLPDRQHAWVLLENKLLVVIKEDTYFYVCGAWEGIIFYKDVELIELINKPEEYKNTKLYYE